MDLYKVFIKKYACVNCKTKGTEKEMKRDHVWSKKLHHFCDNCYKKYGIYCKQYALGKIKEVADDN